MERLEGVAERQVNRHVTGRLAVLPCAEDDPAAAVEYTAVPHVKKGAVDGVGIFAHVLEKEYSVAAVELIGSACGGSDDGQIAARQKAFAPAFRNAFQRRARVFFGVRAVIHAVPVARQHIRKGLMRESVVAEIGGGGHRRVKRHQSAALIDQRMEHSRVAESRENLGVCPDDVVVQQIRESRSAVASAHHNDGAYCRVGKSPVDIARAETVVAGEEAETGAAGRINLRHIAQTGDKFRSEREAFGKHRRAWRYQRNPVSLFQWLRYCHGNHSVS